jgi:hypothetical protein
VREVLAKAEPLLQRLVDSRGSVDSRTCEFEAIYNTLKLASAACPWGYFADYYTLDLKRPTEPFILDHREHSSKYGPIGDHRAAELYSSFVAPAIEACNAVMDDFKALMIDTSSRVVFFARLTGFEHFLDRLATVLAPPWARAIRTDDLTPNEITQPVWLALAMLQFEQPLHVRLLAVRRANLDTVLLQEEKTREVVAALQGVLEEIPFSKLRAEPVPVPATLIQIDRSVTVESGATVRESAIGADARRG